MHLLTVSTTSRCRVQLHVAYICYVNSHCAGNLNTKLVHTHYINKKIIKVNRFFVSNLASPFHKKTTKVRSGILCTRFSNRCCFLTIDKIFLVQMSF